MFCEKDAVAELGIAFSRKDSIYGEGHFFPVCANHNFSEEIEIRVVEVLQREFKKVPIPHRILSEAMPKLVGPPLKRINATYAEMEELNREADRFMQAHRIAESFSNSDSSRESRPAAASPSETADHS